MVSIETAREMALALPEVEEKSHFELPDFRLRSKIFASLHVDKNIMMIKLSEIDQSVLCLADPDNIFPVPGGWGQRGATFFRLNKMKKSLLAVALTCGWKNIATKSLKEMYFPGSEQ